MRLPICATRAILADDGCNRNPGASRHSNGVQSRVRVPGGIIIQKLAVSTGVELAPLSRNVIPVFEAGCAPLRDTYHGWQKMTDLNRTRFHKRRPFQERLFT